MGFAVIAHALIYLVVTSRLGRAMRAIKLNEPLAQSQGINPLSYKLLAPLRSRRCSRASSAACSSSI